MGKYERNVRAQRGLRIEPLEQRVLLAGDVIYRVNAGGGELPGDPVWESDSGQYVSATNTFSSSAAITLDPGTPAETPPELFQTERWDPESGGDMSWAFPVVPGDYEVRIFFAENFGTAAVPGGRVFDVTIEGNQVLNDYDAFVAAGSNANVGVTEIFNITADSEINIEFHREVQNPSVKGFEILSLDATPNQLSVSRGGVNFGEILIGDSQTEQITLRNIGDLGDPTITIDPASVTLGDPGFRVTFPSPGIASLAPGESLTVDVTYSPTTTIASSTTLTIPHSGVNSPIVVNLSGAGVDAFSIGFTTSTLDLAGAGLSSPTSLQFGPDGRLYVAQIDGFIKVFDVDRSGPNNYSVTAAETIDVVRDIPNFNDDGSAVPGVIGRLITGLIVRGTAEDPVIYVSNSDPRFYNANIDSKSGQIARLTRVGSEWTRHDVVRGIPRSKADHASNGFAFLRDENGALTNTLLHSIGGNTNRGGPSSSFRDLPEMALGAAILAIDLDAIGETTYDIPSLDDEDRGNTGVVDEFGVPVDINDHIGGNNGKNQSRLVPNGPVQIYSPGYRNSFDVLVTQDGRVYATDNGPNNGFGVNVAVDGEGLPTNDLVPGSGSNITAPDQLHYIPSEGFFAGHVNPTRANANNTFNSSNPQSPVITTVNGNVLSLENPGEFPLLEPGSDGALRTFNGSTNGIAEYTASNFGGALRGDILTISLNGNLTRVKHNPDTGELLVNEVLANGLGPRSLDVTTVGTGPLAGTIWVTSLDGSAIRVLEPSDGAGGTPDDLDGDGYSNQDEEDNGTNPNNAASVPADFDGDFTSDLNDPNDDNDALDDIDDPFAIDPLNGTGNPIGTYYAWANEATPAGKLLDLGLTGSMINGVTNYLDTFDPADVTPIGAAGVFTIDSALPGTARGSANNIQQALQFGFDPRFETEPFTAVTQILGPNNGVGVPTPGQEQGFYIGVGDQDNYAALILTGQNAGTLELIVEVDGILTTAATTHFPVPTPDNVDLYLTLDPIAHTVQAWYRRDTEIDPTPLGSPAALPASWFDNSMAIGLWSSDPTASGNMPVTWNHLGVVRDPADKAASALVTVDGGGGVFTSTTTVDNAFEIENTSLSGQEIDSVTIDLSTTFVPDLLFDPSGGVGDATGAPVTANSGQSETGFLTHVYGGARDGGFEEVTLSFNDFGVGETFGFSGDIDPTSIKGVLDPVFGAEDVAGFELAGATVTVNYSDGTTTVSQLAPVRGSAAAFTEGLNGALAAPTISILGIGSMPTVVGPSLQTVRIEGPVGATVSFQQAEAALFTSDSPGFEVTPYEANSVLSTSTQTVLIGGSGFVDVPINLQRSRSEGGLNYFLASVEDVLGRRSDVATLLVEARPAGAAAIDYDGSGVVDHRDLAVWRDSYGSTTNLAADGNGDGVINSIDYAVWRENLGVVTPPPPVTTTVVNIDFGADDAPLYVGLGAAPDAGTLWNGVSNSSSTGTPPLVTSTGSPTSIGLQFDAIQQFDTGNDSEGEVGLSGEYSPLIQDYFYTTGLKNLTLIGLDPAATYELYLYGQGDKLNQESTFTVNGVSKTTAFDTPTNDGLLVEDIEYVVFRGLTPTITGTVPFTFSGVDNNGGLNGLQLIETVPSGAALLPAATSTGSGSDAQADATSQYASPPPAATQLSAFATENAAPLTRQRPMLRGNFRATSPELDSLLLLIATDRVDQVTSTGQMASRPAHIGSNDQWHASTIDPVFESWNELPSLGDDS